MRQNCSKVVIENFFEPCLLYLLLQKPSYGYEIKTNLDERCACQVNIGNLYRNLARLQKNGFIQKKKEGSEKGPERVIYQITTKGEMLLKEWIDGLEEQKKTINKLIINYKKHYATRK